MKTSFTKKPMKPITTNPKAVCKTILLNSAKPQKVYQRLSWSILQALRLHVRS